MDLQRIALEGDIQRLQMVLQEKENHLRNYQERVDNQTRSAGQIEDRYTFLSLEFLIIFSITYSSY